MTFFVLIVVWTVLWLGWNFLAPARLQFDPPMAPELFSLDVPAGYEVFKENDEPLLSFTGCMIAILRFYAAQTGGEFPPRIDDNWQATLDRLKLTEDPENQTPEQKQFLRRLNEFSQVISKNWKAGEAFQRCRPQVAEQQRAVADQHARYRGRCRHD